MTTISSISELLSLSGSQFRIYDVGRKIDKISKDTFNKIELNQLPYPYPTQSHACLAVVFWQKNAQQPFIWFIKLPLDERGLLNQGARNHYIAIIIEALGNNITDTPSEKQEELLKNNPYHFTPAQYKLAALNSIVNTELKRPMSSHYELFTDYISGNVGWDNWQNIGVQGINDFASKIHEPELNKPLTLAFNALPEQVINPLCTALENQSLPLNLIETILQKLQHSKLNEDTQNNLLRSLSSSSAHPLVESYITSLLQQPSSISTNTLILFAGRLWNVFSDTETLLAYFEAIAAQNDVELFAEIFKDLVSIPTLRPHVFQVMRSPERSSALSAAIGHIFQTTHKT